MVLAGAFFDSFRRFLGLGLLRFLLYFWVCFPGPGLAPAGEVLSCCAARKYPKKRAPQSATPTLRAGANLGRDAGGVRCGTRCALRASLKQPQRVSSRSMRDFAHATPPAPRPRRSLKGGGARHGPSLRSAWRARRAAPACWGPSAAMARVGLQPPSGRTEERRAWGGRVCRRTHALRELTCRVCLNAAPQARSELRGTAPRPSTAGCPGAKRRGYGQQGRASFASFSCTSKKRRSPAGASPGPGKQTHSKRSKKRATSACYISAGAQKHPQTRVKPGPRPARQRP